MTTNILYDTRLGVKTTFTLWGLFLHHFDYDIDGKIVVDRKSIEPKKKRLAAAKKEIEALGGYMIFVVRGAHHIEILYKVPK